MHNLQCIIQNDFCGGVAENVETHLILSSYQHCKNRINTTFHKVKAAFTIAEVIIALVVLGVVAAFVVPSMIQNGQAKINEKKYDVIVHKMRQAINMMRINGELEKFNSTDDFVNALQNYLKINKRCNSTNLNECWPTDKVKTTDGQTIEVSTATVRSKLGFSDEDNPDNANVGLILADGTQIILTYDINKDGYLAGDMEHDSMEGLAFVTDVNGSRGPNRERYIGYKKEKYYDIYGFNNATFSKYCNGYYADESCEAAEGCDTYIENKVCQISTDGCNGVVDSVTRLCNSDTSGCVYVDDDKRCHTKSTDCTKGFVENGKCNTNLDDCNGYITADRKCDTDVSDCKTYLKNNECQASKDTCEGYINEDTLKCEEKTACTGGYVDTIEKTCNKKSDCTNGYVSNYECITDKTQCTNGYVSNYECNTDKTTCSGYVSNYECLEESTCTSQGGTVYNHECQTGSVSKIACNNLPLEYKSYATYIESDDKCLVNLGKYNSAPTWKAIDCRPSNSIDDDYKTYCGCLSGSVGCSNGYPTSSYAFASDYWAGAKRACESIGSGWKLPEKGSNVGQLNYICKNYKELGISSANIYYWTSTPPSNQAKLSWVVKFSGGDCGSYCNANFERSSAQYYVLCIFAPN